MLSIANYITLLRIIGAMCLLPLEVTSRLVSPFWLIYAFCGISDMADGYVARKLKTETKAGALLDSIADIVFMICCTYKLLPLLKLPSWLWCLVVIIVVIKLINQVSAWIVHKRVVFPHTFANKLTGIMLFISIPFFVCFELYIPLILTSAVATYAAIQEGHLIRTRNNKRKILSLVFTLVVTSCWAQNPINVNSRQPFQSSEQREPSNPDRRWLSREEGKRSQSKSHGACIMRNDSIVGINVCERFAMHSVMKFPQALYVADYLSRKGLDLDDTIVVDKADLMHDTWSPMLKQFEGDGAFSYAELLELSLGQSDNNACELLFKYCGRPIAVENYMRKLGFHDIHIRITEKQMHKNQAKAIENSSTPAEMVRLFEWFYHQKDDDPYLAFIWQTMANCSTGLKRIPTAIPADARIIHKTGTGFPSAYGAQDMNDAGIIIMPDGSHVIIAIFTTNSTSETEIANIARELLEK